MNYNIGLDIGSASVGWAVVEENTGKIIKKGKGSKRKALWGVSLFEEANNAKKRRGFRGTRRRYDRRRERISLLQEEFKNEIDKIDENFYLKLREFKYIRKEEIPFYLKSNEVRHKTVDFSLEDKKIFNEYKTIYHLRKALMEEDRKFDIRQVYLAIHHIIKYRGNFLYSQDVKDFNIQELSISKKLNDIFMQLDDLIDLEFSFEDLKNVEDMLLNESKNDIKKKIEKMFTSNKNFGREFGKLLVGNEFSVNKLFNIDSEEKDKDKISFSKADCNKKIEDLRGESLELVLSLKELYDLVNLKKMFKVDNCNSISTLMVDKYQKHKKDLKKLKEIFNDNRKVYNEIFRNKKSNCLYDSYIHNKMNEMDFYKEIEKRLDKIGYTQIEEIKKDMDNHWFLPRITDIGNSMFPYQLNEVELMKIIENQKKYYPFLGEKINDKYKLVMLLEFRIPYYVGPLNSNSEWSWVIRKEGNKEKITPYNFDFVIDKTKTAKEFIDRMRSHCTYLFNEFALPNNSILYSEYKVRNELKQIKVDGDRLSLDLQEVIIDNLFKKEGNITDKKFKKFLMTLPDFLNNKELVVTGYSATNKFANSMQSYIDFFGENGIFKGTDYKEVDAEKIIEWITIFKEKDILREKIEQEYQFNDEQLNNILSKNYTGWGNLSKGLLTNRYYKDKKDNNYKSILDLMRETQENFMQIINNDKYKFQKMIAEKNKFENNSTQLSYDLVDELPTSSANKRGIYQALKIVDEIILIMKGKPKNIMIEMARGKENTGRTDDRKKIIEDRYKKIMAMNEEPDNFKEMVSKLNEYEKIDTDKLYLYFLQCGKCMYSGKTLDINNLEAYEIDHILPRFLCCDNSIDNRVLVYKECNQNKKNSLVVPKEYQKQKAWWYKLKKMNLISAKKYYLLTREVYSDDDINGFINRQLVETRQITKHVANILKNLYGVNIVYLKAKLSSDYRKAYELFKYRELNDYHHAHDAYLAVVLGEYKEKYLRYNITLEFIREMNERLVNIDKRDKLKYNFVVNSLDEDVFDIVKDLSTKFVNNDTGEVLFDVKKFNEMVENTLYRNDILVSRKPSFDYGEFYNQTIYNKNEALIPLKSNMPINIYGGYKRLNIAYMALISYDDSKKIIGIPIYVALKNNKEEVRNYIINSLQKTIKDIDTLKILKEKIPCYTLLYFKGQYVYLRSASELWNACELKISQEYLKKWKYLLNFILNGVKCDLSEKEIKLQAKELLNYLLVDCKKNYPLFANHIEKIKKVDFDSLSIEEICETIKQVFLMYKCNSEKADLKYLNKYGKGSLKFVDGAGRLNNRSVDSGTLIFKSVTGYKESKYEF